MNIKNNLTFALVIVALMWIGFVLELVFPGLAGWGIRPRTASGLWGIVFCPFLHLNLNHLLSNTIPIFILLLLALSYNRVLTLEALAIITLLGGGLVWLFGRPNVVVIGASGVVFGLVGFLLLVGVFRREFIAVLVAVIVLLLYGSALFYGLVPRPGISFMGHAFGFLSGVVAAWLAGRAKRGKV
jgi:membrane associated rhomboid family serine protease